MNTFNRLLMCVTLICLMTAWTFAQNSSEDKSKSEVRTMTGCLTQNGNNYTLTANDGSTWEIHGNSSVDLASQVNHTVEVTGAVSHTMAHNMKEDEKDMAHDTGMKKNNAEHGHLKATDVHQVSDSCHQ
ncbi:MAG TPA: hypothetical protein VGM18_11355 [Candidatus Sulfotelmatobacter sp.]